MPRSTKEIIDQADALARRFEDHVPDPSDLKRADTLRQVREAFLARARADTPTGRHEFVVSTNRSRELPNQIATGVLRNCRTSPGRAFSVRTDLIESLTGAANGAVCGAGPGIAVA